MYSVAGFAHAAGDNDERARSLVSQSFIAANKSQLPEALELATQALRLAQEHGLAGLIEPIEGVVLAITVVQNSRPGYNPNAEGIALEYEGNLTAALQRYREYEVLSRHANDARGIAVARHNQAEVHMFQGELQKAQAMLEEAEKEFRKHAQWQGLAKALGNQALIQREKGNYDAAQRLHQEEERLSCQIDDKETLAESLLNQATVLRLQNKLTEALAIIDRCEQVAHGAKSELWVCEARSSRALVLRQMGKPEQALALLDGEENIVAALKHRSGVIRNLLSRAQLLFEDLRRPKDALPLIEEAHRLASESGFALLLRQTKLLLDAVRASTQVATQR